MTERGYQAAAGLLGDVAEFSRVGIRTHPLRPYQIEPIRAAETDERSG